MFLNKVSGKAKSAFAASFNASASRSTIVSGVPVGPAGVPVGLSAGVPVGLSAGVPVGPVGPVGVPVGPVDLAERVVVNTALATLISGNTLSTSEEI